MSLWTVCHLEAFVSDNESAARTCTPWTTSESAFSLKLLITTLGLSNGGIIHQVLVWKRFMWGARPQQFKGRRRTAVAEVRKTRAYSSIHISTHDSCLYFLQWPPPQQILPGGLNSLDMDSPLDDYEVDIGQLIISKVPEELQTPKRRALDRAGKGCRRSSLTKSPSTPDLNVTPPSIREKRSPMSARTPSWSGSSSQHNQNTLLRSSDLAKLPVDSAKVPKMRRWILGIALGKLCVIMTRPNIDGEVSWQLTSI